MSMDASINFCLGSHLPIEIFKLLLRNDWGFSSKYHSKIVYTLEDESEDIKFGNMDFDKLNQLISIFEGQVGKEKWFSILLMWKESYIGGNFRFNPVDAKYNTFDLSIDLTASELTKTILGDSRISDFSWYLEKIVPIFKERDIQILDINCANSFW